MTGILSSKSWRACGCTDFGSTAGLLGISGVPLGVDVVGLPLADPLSCCAAVVEDAGSSFSPVVVICAGLESVTAKVSVNVFASSCTNYLPAGAAIAASEGAACTASAAPSTLRESPACEGAPNLPNGRLCRISSPVVGPLPNALSASSLSCLAPSYPPGPPVTFGSGAWGASTWRVCDGTSRDLDSMPASRGCVWATLMSWAGFSAVALSGLAVFVICGASVFAALCWTELFCSCPGFSFFFFLNIPLNARFSESMLLPSSLLWD